MALTHKIMELENYGLKDSASDPANMEIEQLRELVRWSRAKLEELQGEIERLKREIEEKAWTDIHELLAVSEIGLKWKRNSALEEWFPITAEELAKLRKDNARMIKALECVSIAWENTPSPDWKYIAPSVRIAREALASVKETDNGRDS